MSDYWRRAGFSVKTTTQAGVKVTRPDFFVVRLSLLGLEDCARSRLFVDTTACLLQFGNVMRSTAPQRREQVRVRERERT